MKMALRIAPALAALLVSAAASAQDPSAPAAPAAAPAGKPADRKAEPAKAGEAAVPQSVANLTGEATAGDRKIPFGGIVTFEQVLGLGSFVSDKYARNPYYGWSISLRPRYYITNNLSLEARFDFDWELTTSYATGTSKKRQVMPSDLTLTLRYQNAYKIPVAGITISPYVRLGAPTSYESRYRNLYLSTALGVSFGRNFANKVILDYTIRATKNFNRTTTATVTGPVAVARARGNEDLGSGEVSTGDPNVEWSLLNSLLASWVINDQWSLSLSLAIINSWTYSSIPKDALSSAYAKAGRGQRDRTQGVIDVTYQPWEHFGFSLGINSVQPAKSADNKSFRFPFFDFRSEPNNYTNFYFDVFATY